MSAQKERKERKKSPTAKLQSSPAMLSLKPKSKPEIMWPTDPLEYNRKQGQGQLYYNCLRPPRLFENRVKQNEVIFFLEWTF